MGIARRKKSEFDQRRDELLNIALELFLEKGYEDFYMMDLAERMGCSRRTLYSYFKSKDDVCFALYLKNLKERLDFVCTVFNETDPPDIIIANFFRKYFQYVLNHKNYYSFELHLDTLKMEDIMTSDENIKCYDEITKEYFTHVLHTLQRGIDEGYFKKDIHPRVMLAQIVFTGRGILRQSAIKPEGTYVIKNGMISAEEFHELYIRIILDGIKQY